MSAIEKLCIAARNGNLALVQRLVEQMGVNVNGAGRIYAQTALMRACLYKRVDVAIFLADHPETQVNQQDFRGSTALILAAYVNSVDIVQHLLTKPTIQVNQQEDNHGYTALHWCILHDHQESAALLLRHPRIDVSIKDKNGRTALHCAVERNHIAMLKTLLSSSPGGVPINQQANNGNTVLHCCCIKKWSPRIKAQIISFQTQIQMAHVLLNHRDIDMLIKNNDGKTALDLALEQNHLAINQLMLRRLIIISIESHSPTKKRKRVVV